MIGTATGWDHGDTFAMGLHDFEPIEGAKLPACSCLWINFEDGNAVTYDDEGNILQCIDLISAIAHLPREQGEQ
jgi:hypothetical protein